VPFSVVDSGVHAIAVIFDLVDPFLARRRLVHQARELRLDPLRRPRCCYHDDQWSIFSLPAQAPPRPIGSCCGPHCSSFLGVGLLTRLCGFEPVNPLTACATRSRKACSEAASRANLRATRLALEPRPRSPPCRCARAWAIYFDAHGRRRWRAKAQDVCLRPSRSAIPRETFQGRCLYPLLPSPGPVAHQSKRHIRHPCRIGQWHKTGRVRPKVFMRSRANADGTAQVAINRQGRPKRRRQGRIGAAARHGGRSTRGNNRSDCR
jgi:hypothetical protein